MPQRIKTSWKLRSRELKLGERTLVMGVVNITPDSFSDGGLYMEPELAIEHALRLLDEGADLLDLGAESTRPGSHAGNPQSAVSAEDEQARLLPVLEGLLRARPDAIVSIDTYKSATARAALAAGAEIINDVSGLNWGSEMAEVCAGSGCGVVLMHTRGRPEEWSEQPRLAPEAVLSAVSEGLSLSLETSLAAGIRAEAIVLDPGYGFGKRLEENYALLARQAELLSFGMPLLAGLSRKSFLVRTLEKASRASGYIDEESRDTASVVALTMAIHHGASIVRVHRVRPAVDAAAIADAILQAEGAVNANGGKEKSP